MQPLKYDFSDLEGAASVRLAEIVDRIGETYRDGFGVNHLDGVNLPRRAEIVEITEKLLEVIFPGFDGRRHVLLKMENKVRLLFVQIGVNHWDCSKNIIVLRN